MEKPIKLVLVPCGCGSRYPVVCPTKDVGRTISCPWSSQPMLVGGGTPFDGTEWDRCRDPSVLQGALLALRIRFSDRKRRLMTCGIARLIQSPDPGAWTELAIETGEALADETPPPLSPEVIRRHLPPGLGHECIDPRPLLYTNVAEHDDHLVAQVYEDQFPNPFVPLEWNPEWFTSTVRDLAAHIYESRDFSVMPILGDALMDAGCDHQLIQDHCRTEKPHARGCWVVDAILGKT
jgi:hypothetical protein